MDAVQFLQSYRSFSHKALIYLDPPYLESVRSSGNRIYKHEFMTEAEHIELLEAVRHLPAMVMISGYQSELYDAYLFGWRKHKFNMINRAGDKTDEIVWMNFPEPQELHDYQFLGEGFRERERIKKKRRRLKRRLLKMDRYERLALIATVEEVKSDISSSV